MVKNRPARKNQLSHNGHELRFRLRFPCNSSLILVGPGSFLIIALAACCVLFAHVFVLPIYSFDEGEGREHTKNVLMEEFTKTTSKSKTALQVQSQDDQNFPSIDIKHRNSPIKGKNEEEENNSNPQRGYQRALEEATHEYDSNKLVPGTVVLSGLARSTSEIQNETWQVLTDLSCKYNVSIQVTAKSVDYMPFEQRFCAPLDVRAQDSVLRRQKLPRNRLLRLALIRDAQRRLIRRLFFSERPSPRAQSSSFVVVLDLDLFRIPSAELIYDRIRTMQKDPENYVTCGLGNWRDHPHLRGTEFYYDSLALVHLPDTWSFRRQGRLTQLIYPWEDASMVLEKPRPETADIWTNYELMTHFRQEAAKYPQGIAPVRSCFGGLAIYKASAWLFPSCGYTVQLKTNADRVVKIRSFHELRDSILRYAKKADQFPCEHVVLHDCLHRQVFHTALSDSTSRAVGIDPMLVTEWLQGEESK